MKRTNIAQTRMGIFIKEKWDSVEELAPICLEELMRENQAAGEAAHSRQNS
jgi:hypothetical protein